MSFLCKRCCPVRPISIRKVSQPPDDLESVRERVYKAHLKAQDARRIARAQNTALNIHVRAVDRALEASKNRKVRAQDPTAYILKEPPRQQSSAALTLDQSMGQTRSRDPSINWVPPPDIGGGVPPPLPPPKAFGGVMASIVEEC